MIAFVAAVFFPLVMAIAGTDDVLSRRISNRLTLLVPLSFFPMAWAAGMPMDMMLVHAGMGIGVLAAGFALFACGLIGGGDAKLLAGAAVWFGLDALVPFLAMTVIAGGLLSLAVLAWSLFVIDADPRGSGLSRRIGWLWPSVPYGYAIAAGAILAFPESWWGGLLPR